MDKQLTRLQEGIHDLLWDQWSALGVAGRSSGKGLPFVIDPEALLLATIRFGSDDGRLVAEVLDWLSKNGGLMSLQRLKNLQTNSGLGTREGLEEIGHFMEREGFRNWKSLRSWASKVSSSSGQSGVFVNRAMRNMSQVPDFSRPELFLLRMRRIFGVNARPEVLTWLLMHHEGYAAEIASETDWFSKSVQAILNDLELAELVVSSPEGKRKVFTLNPRNGIFDPSLGKESLQWFWQRPFYFRVRRTMQTLVHLKDMSDASESAKAITIRKEMLMTMASRRLPGAENPFAGGASLKGEALVQFFEDGVAHLSTFIERRNP